MPHQNKPNNTHNHASNNANTTLTVITSSNCNYNNTLHHKKLQQPNQEVITTADSDNHNAMFHDFLGMKPSSSSKTDSPALLGSSTKNPPPDASPSASLSAGAASSGGGAGVRCPLSTASDLASERQVANHLEGIPYYGPRSDISGSEISNKLLRSKRSNSDSAFTGSTRDGIPHISHDSLESLHLMKMLKNGGGADRPRRSKDDEVSYGMQAMRPSAASLILHSSTGGRLDANVSKWERSIPVGTAAIQYPPRAGQLVPFMHQVPPNKLRDISTGASIISQLAADEGSRTGIKGPGILSSINAGSGISEKNSSGVLPSSSKSKSGAHVSYPESSTPSSRQGLTSASRQMTVFYGGQAHVFDDVHPNKADVIMALAGSNGGSWSTTYSPKPTVMRPVCETSGETEAAMPTDALLQHELRGRLSGSGNASHGVVGSGDRISTAIGSSNHSTISKNQAVEGSPEEKKEC